MTARSPGSRRTHLRLLAVGFCVGALLLGISSWPTAQEPEDDSPRRVSRYGDLISVFGGRIVVPENIRQRGTIVNIGGDVIIEGQVSQDVVVVLGTLTLTGTVDGSVTAVLSDQTLRDATIDDQYVSVLGDVRMERTRIRDEFFHVLGPLSQDTFSTRPVVNVGTWFPSFWVFLFWFRLLRLLVVFVLLLMLAALVPERIRLIADQAPARYVSAFFMGILGYLGFWILFILASATVIGIPVVIVGYYVLKWLGIAGVFLAIGQRLGRSFGREMSLLGAILLTFTVYVLLTMVPSPLGLFGLLLSLVLRVAFFLAVEAPAVGLVLLTRVGTRRRGESPARPPVAPRPPPPPPPVPSPAVPQAPPPTPRAGPPRHPDDSEPGAGG